jgi:hypothetical protein
MIATDVPNRAYAHHKLIYHAAQIDSVVRALGITMVVVVNSEWSSSYREHVARLFPRLHEWEYAAVYRVNTADSLRTRGTANESPRAVPP